MLLLIGKYIWKMLFIQHLNIKTNEQTDTTKAKEWKIKPSTNPVQHKSAYDPDLSPPMHSCTCQAEG